MAALDVREGVDEATVAAVAKLSGKYKYGWETEIETDYAPIGLNEDIVRLIIPELQCRGRFRRAYEHATLRGHLGLARPSA